MLNAVCFLILGVNNSTSVSSLPLKCAQVLSEKSKNVTCSHTFPFLLSTSHWCFIIKLLSVYPTLFCLISSAGRHLLNALYCREVLVPQFLDEFNHLFWARTSETWVTSPLWAGFSGSRSNLPVSCPHCAGSVWTLDAFCLHPAIQYLCLCSDFPPSSLTTQTSHPTSSFKSFWSPSNSTPGHLKLSVQTSLQLQTSMSNPINLLQELKTFLSCFSPSWQYKIRHKIKAVLIPKPVFLLCFSALIQATVTSCQTHLAPSYF